MALDPSKFANPIDLFGYPDTFNASGSTATGTRAGSTLALPPGKKAVQISQITSSTQVVKIQNSLDKTNWFDVVAATNTSLLAEVESVVPYWRVNVTSHTTSGTGASAPTVAMITLGPT